MTAENVRQRRSGFSANALPIVHRIRRGSQQIGSYDVITYDAIERIKQLNGGNGKKRKGHD